MKQRISGGPFEFLMEDGWELIADDSDEYRLLDDAYRLLNDGYDSQNIYSEELLKMTLPELHRWYEKHLSIFIGEYLEEVGKSMKEGKLTIELVRG